MALTNPSGWTQVASMTGRSGSLMGGQDKLLGGIWTRPGGAQYDIGGGGAYGAGEGSSNGGPSLGRLRGIAMLNKQDYMDQAATGVQQQADLQTAAANRRLAEMGVQPTSGKYVGIKRQMAIDIAASKAAAMTKAGRYVDEENFNRLARLADMERAQKAQDFSQYLSIENINRQKQAQSQSQMMAQQQFQAAKSSERKQARTLKNILKNPSKYSWLTGGGSASSAAKPQRTGVIGALSPASASTTKAPTATAWRPPQETWTTIGGSSNQVLTQMPTFGAGIRG